MKPGAYRLLFERLKCSDIDAVLHTRIITHGWFTHANSNLARAFVTMGGVYLKHGEEPSQGQPLPSREELVVAGGMTPDNYALPPEQLKKRVYETYSVAYVRDSVVPDTNVFTVSYGEYVPSCNEIDYTPLLKRAEELARFHFSTQAVHSETNDRLQIVRREWFCATHPDIAVVKSPTVLSRHSKELVLYELSGADYANWKRKQR
jgi:hypothetical protein